MDVEVAALCNFPIFISNIRNFPNLDFEAQVWLQKSSFNNVLLELEQYYNLLGWEHVEAEEEGSAIRMKVNIKWKLKNLKALVIVIWIGVH